MADQAHRVALDPPHANPPFSIRERALRLQARRAQLSLLRSLRTYSAPGIKNGCTTNRGPREGTEMTHTVHIGLVPKIVAVVMAAAVGIAGVAADPAEAHADADLVAVPAGEQVTVNLRPQHGCGTSPTIKVTMRAPLEGATAGPVAGWESSAEQDGKGNTVLEWSGGSLPSDEPGAFPVTFTAPGTVGQLLLFPAIQICKSGEEMAWISGDPASEHPAPRLLILAPGSHAAASIDDIPADAPGRALLTSVVEPASTTTSTTTASESVEVPDNSAAGIGSPRAPSTASSAAVKASDDSGQLPIIVTVLAAAAVVAIGGLTLWKRRS